MTQHYQWSLDVTENVTKAYIDHIRWHSVTRPEVAEEVAREMGLELLYSSLCFDERGKLSRKVVFGKLFDSLEDAVLFKLTHGGELHPYDGDRPCR